MKTIVIGEEYIGKEEKMRETCFGILYKNKKFKCASINGEVSLIGGGIEESETHIETLKREFTEEAGLLIDVTKELFKIDCYWKTRNNIIMHSVSNIYEVKEVGKTEIKEDNAMVVEYDSNEILEHLPLPYHKRAIEEYLKNIK